MTGLRSMGAGRIGAALGMALLLALASGVQPAEARQGGQQEAPQDTVRLMLERQVFSYPTFERRNPFRPLTGPDDGPRFEDLRLLGVIFDPDPAGSVALVGLRNGDGARTYRLRVGQVLGNTRIMEIRPQQVVVQVEEFGITETRTMELRRTEPRPEDPEDADDPPDDDDPPPGDEGENTGNGDGDYANGGSS